MGASSAARRSGMRLQSRCADDFKDGVEARATITGKWLVKASGVTTVTLLLSRRIFQKDDGSGDGN